MGYVEILWIWLPSSCFVELKELISTHLREKYVFTGVSTESSFFGIIIVGNIRNRLHLDGIHGLVFVKWIYLAFLRNPRNLCIFGQDRRVSQVLKLLKMTKCEDSWPTTRNVCFNEKMQQFAIDVLDLCTCWFLISLPKSGGFWSKSTQSMHSLQLVTIHHKCRNFIHLLLGKHDDLDQICINSVDSEERPTDAHDPAIPYEIYTNPEDSPRVPSNVKRNNP